MVRNSVLRKLRMRKWNTVALVFCWRMRSYPRTEVLPIFVEKISTYAWFIHLSCLRWHTCPGCDKAFLTDRTGISFSLFWARVLQGKTTEIQIIEDLKLPRKRKAPVRHEFGEQDTQRFPETPKDHYKRMYFNAMDTVTQCIARRFGQEGFEIHVNIQELLLKSFASERCDTELAGVVKTYSEDLDSFKFKGQLLLLPQTAESMGFGTSEFDVNDLVSFSQSLHIFRRKLLSEISTLGKLLLVMPATNAVGEWSFSALRRVKTYLRTTTGDSRLNHLMMLHVHKDRTDAPTLVDVANDFTGEKGNRKQLFGKFPANDIPNKFPISSKST